MLEERHALMFVIVTVVVGAVTTLHQAFMAWVYGYEFRLWEVAPLAFLIGTVGGVLIIGLDLWLERWR